MKAKIGLLGVISFIITAIIFISADYPTWLIATTGFFAGLNAGAVILLNCDLSNGEDKK